MDVFKMTTAMFQIDMENWTLQGLVLAVVIALGFISRSRKVCQTAVRDETEQVDSNQPPTPPTPPLKKPDHEYSADSYYAIEPLSTLDIATEEPIKARPYKPKYHLTMGYPPLSLLRSTS
jgi:hypothetical protein